jgi:hypothetical protein
MRHASEQLNRFKEIGQVNLARRLSSRKCNITAASVMIGEVRKILDADPAQIEE